MSSTQNNNENIPLQVKIYSRWVSTQLTKGNADIQVHDISKDLSNGVALVELAKILTGKEPKHDWAHAPKKPIEMIKNADLSVQMFFEDGVHLIGIAGKDVHDNNVKLLRGYIWTLIERYSIGRSTFADKSKANNRTKNIRDILKQWAIDRTANYPNIHNFQPYSLAMCALLDTYAPDKINYYKLNPNDSTHNAQLAAKVLKELDVPVYILPDDVNDSVAIDEKALLTQLSAAKIYLEKLPPANVKVEENRIISHLSDCIPVEEPPAPVEEPPAPIAVPTPVPATVEPETESDSEDVEPVAKEPVFVAGPVSGDNSQYKGRKFGLIMTLNESDYNNGKQVDLTKGDELLFGNDIKLALTMAPDKNAYLNPAGQKLTIAQPNIENDVFQQFVFGQNEWNTVIDSVQQQGMVWDVADQFNLNPPEGTPFYLFMFHGRHNQHFVYKDNMIYAQQNGHVVTFVGGEHPLVMMPPSNKLRARQTFTIQLL
ncbi:alpha-actinin [Tritrichomonas musculus]|uniref:Alpha-actinin n=1 Tax=Tritrichomonas musculus TaxID=1915356 RepID=A0ABR2I5G5_9EUKA